MGSMSRRKGATFERETAHRWSSALGREAKRRLGQARDSGHDLENTEPFVVECKRRAKIAVYEWYVQACDASAKAGRGSIPVVVMRQDGSEPLVLLSEADFLGRMRPEVAT